ncbi:hypothetical protein LOK49_LG07G01657 [Camellia lanceoleosa]|uniref:Uncharacterized protein n=1 Tax=Camellia lanceoleosa TaxID=1840588 RepID=A0ACC0H8R8_9ERIC|nr:hypothetical protein LOK49_LG07G01657 [Camellia lanceoleosa]
MEVVQGNGNSNYDDGNYNNNDDNKRKKKKKIMELRNRLDCRWWLSRHFRCLRHFGLSNRLRNPLFQEKTSSYSETPSSDCGPCEIKLSFAQKHEVRQVYIRSTARVFESYFAPSLHSGNEYLCTVRCGIAARDGKVLHPTNTEEPVDAQPNGSARELAKDKCDDDGPRSLREGCRKNKRNHSGLF